jgi:hypothetical protein
MRWASASFRVNRFHARWRKHTNARENACSAAGIMLPLTLPAQIVDTTRADGNDLKAI